MKEVETMRLSRFAVLFAILASSLAALAPMTGAQGTTLTIYSGRNEELVGPIIDQFEKDTGINVEVRYDNTTTLALALVEEGKNTPADIFFAQDAGALGLLEKNNLLLELPSYILESVEPRFHSQDGFWVGITGRARVVTYNTDNVSPEALPESLLGFADPTWKGRIGFAPTNASFHAHLTALRVELGDEAMQAFVQALVDNEAVPYEGNSAAVAAVAAGEVDVALVNHYYMFGLLKENPDAPLANYYFPGDDVGNLINIAGAAILNSSDNVPLAQQFIAYMLSRTAQQYFSDSTFEYPLLIGFEADPRLVPLAEIQTPEVDLTDLDDLETTLALLDEVINQ